MNPITHAYFLEGDMSPKKIAPSVSAWGDWMMIRKLLSPVD